MHVPLIILPTTMPSSAGGINGKIALKCGFYKSLKSAISVVGFGTSRRIE
jgi:hypothetical protein